MKDNKNFFKGIIVGGLLGIIGNVAASWIWKLSNENMTFGLFTFIGLCFLIVLFFKKID